MHKMSSLFALLVLPGALAGQAGRLTLGEARSRAAASHPEIQASKAAAQAAHATARAAGRLENPRISLDYEAAGRDRLRSSEIIAAVEQPLDLWGRRTHRADAASLTADAADARVSAAIAIVTEATTRAFLEAVAAEWRVIGAERTLGAFDRATTIINARRETGDAAGLDVRRLQLERTRALARVASARRDRQIAVGELAGLVGAAPGALLDLALVMDTTPNFDTEVALDSLLVAAHRFAGGLRALDLSRQAAGAEAAGARSARVPIPSLRLGSKWSTEPDGTTRHGFVGGVSLPLPAWNGGGAAVDAAMANERAADATFDARRREIEVAVHAAWEGLGEQSQAFADLSAEIEEHAAPIREALDVAFAEGELTLTEWLDAIRTDQDTTNLHAELWLELATRLAQLERLTGLAFFEGTP